MIRWYLQNTDLQDGRKLHRGYSSGTPGTQSIDSLKKKSLDILNTL